VPNYIKNRKAMARLNPYAAHARANAHNRSVSIAAARKNPVAKKAPKKGKKVPKLVSQQKLKKFLYAKYRKLVFSK